MMAEQFLFRIGRDDTTWKMVVQRMQEKDACTIDRIKTSVKTVSKQRYLPHKIVENEKARQKSEEQPQSEERKPASPKRLIKKTITLDTSKINSIISSHNLKVTAERVANFRETMNEIISMKNSKKELEKY